MPDSTLSGNSFSDVHFFYPKFSKDPCMIYAQTTSETYDNTKRYHQRECDFTHSGRDTRSKSKVISNYEQKGVLVPINV